MSYSSRYEASKALPFEHVTKQLAEFAASGQDLSDRRFSRSPPTVPSSASTKWEESEPPSPGELLYDKESKELRNSRAGAQFEIQAHDERERLRAAYDKGILQYGRPLDWQWAAEANVKYRWIRQGLWDERWANPGLRTWKHELHEPPPPERSPKAMTASGVIDLRTGRKRRHSEVDREYRESMQCAIDFQNREASRPCYQFVYQLCQEREWIKMGLSQPDPEHDTDLDPRAYEAVKSRWIRDGIWDDDWRQIPGTTWKHERPRKYPSRHEDARKFEERKAARTQEADRPQRWYFVAPAEPKKPMTRFYSPSQSPIAPKASEPGLESAPPAMHSPRVRYSKPQASTDPPSPAHSPKPNANESLNPTSRGHIKRQTKSSTQELFHTDVTPTTNQISENPHPKLDSKPKATKQRTSTTRISKARSSSTMSQKPTASTAPSRPRRAAAAKAMQKITKSHWM